MSSDSFDSHILKQDLDVVGISQDTPVVLSHEIQYHTKIGGGNYGSVWLGLCRGKEVAIKKFFKQDLEDKSINDFKKEVEICCRIHHPNVVLFMGACVEPGSFALVTEFLPKGNLEDLIHDPKRHFSLYARLRMGLDVAKGMNWLHCSKPPIIHRDLKPSNLLVDEYDNIKVCDFGFSTLRTSSKGVVQEGKIVGSPLWMAPEVMEGKNVSEKADVYSFAIVLWEMVTLEEPFPEYETFYQLRDAVCYNHARPPISSSSYPSSIIEMIQNCWNMSPLARPSFGQIIEKYPNLLIDSVISDPQVKRFWTNYFDKHEMVLWEDFVSRFAEAFLNEPLDPSSPQYKCFKLLLAKKSTDSTLKRAPEYVSVEDFGNLISWFGPISPTLDGCANMLEYLVSNVKKKWFHGKLSMTAASERLSSYTKGHFLIRLSNTGPGQFTISKVEKGNTISHQRFTYQYGVGFSIRLKDPKTGALKMVTEQGISLKKFVSKISADFGLAVPCPGRSSDLDQIFMKTKASGTTGYILETYGGPVQGSGSGVF